MDSPTSTREKNFARQLRGTRVAQRRAPAKTKTGSSSAARVPEELAIAELGATYAGDQTAAGFARYLAELRKQQLAVQQAGLAASQRDARARGGAALDGRTQGEAGAGVNPEQYYGDQNEGIAPSENMAEGEGNEAAQEGEAGEMGEESEEEKKEEDKEKEEKKENEEEKEKEEADKEGKEQTEQGENAGEEGGEKNGQDKQFEAGGGKVPQSASDKQKPGSQAGGEKPGTPGGPGGTQAQGPTSERERAQQLREEQAASREEQKPKPEEIVADAAPQLATGQFLRTAWLSVIPSWGLTLIYINFHFVMAYFGSVFSRFFPKFGEEWVPKGLKGIAKRSGALEIGEIILLFVADAIILTILVVLLAIFGLIAWVFVDPLNAVWSLLKWSFIDTIKLLFSLAT